MNEQPEEKPSPSGTQESGAIDEPRTRKPWETPVLEELAVQLSAINPGVGADGGVADCSHS